MMSEIKATAADAEVVMRLYDMRREPVMRDARNWLANFMPQSADDVLKVYQQWGAKENAYMRQVTSFWEMAASLVLHGAVHPGVFWDWSGELIFVYAKFVGFLPELRQKVSPEFLAKCEQAIHASPQAQKKLEQMVARQKQFAAMKASAETK
jgi:hypothetical protein